LILEFPKALEAVTRVFEYGAQKYGRRNWRLGRNYCDTIDSLARHAVLFINGEDIDEESGLPHVDFLVSNAMFLSEWYRTHPEKDDRG
jgi:hypothetical protein